MLWFLVYIARCFLGLDYGDSDDDESDEDQDREDNKEDKYGQSSSDDDDYEERLRRKRELFGRTQRSRLDDIEREEMELISKKKRELCFEIFHSNLWTRPILICLWK